MRPIKSLIAYVIASIVYLSAFYGGNALLILFKGQTIKIAWNRVPVYLVSDIIKKTLPVHVRHKKAEVRTSKMWDWRNVTDLSRL